MTPRRILLHQVAADPRVLLIARDPAGIAAELASRRPGLDVLARAPDDVRADDGRGRNVLVAFRVPPALRGAMDEVRWIQSTGAGVDGILEWAGLGDDVLVTRLVDVFGDVMADYVLSRLLAWRQEIPRLERDRAAARWHHFEPRPLSGLRAVVLGAGGIGAPVGRRLLANGVRVVGVTRGGRPVEGLPVVLPISRLGEALAGAEALVVLVPRTRETEDLVGAAELACLAPGAFLVNASRGATLDDAALLDALDRGHLSGAALDVFREEPLPATSPFWARDDVMISPHVAAVTAPWMVAEALLRNLDRLAQGESPLGAVDRALGY